MLGGGCSFARDPGARSCALAPLRAPGRQWVAGRLSREVVVVVFLLRLMSMGHCSEQRPGFEVTKDWNGADQVAIRSPRGASVRVSRFCLRFFVLPFPTGDRLGISRSREELGLMRAFGCGMGAGLPARRAGGLVEERPRRGAPFHQQQGEFVSAPMLCNAAFFYSSGGGFGDPVTVTNCAYAHLITVPMNIQSGCLQKYIFISVYTLMALEKRISLIKYSYHIYHGTSIHSMADRQIRLEDFRITHFHLIMCYPLSLTFFLSTCGLFS